MLTKNIQRLQNTVSLQVQVTNTSLWENTWYSHSWIRYDLWRFWGVSVTSTVLDRICGIIYLRELMWYGRVWDFIIEIYIFISSLMLPFDINTEGIWNGRLARQNLMGSLSTYRAIKPHHQASQRYAKTGAPFYSHKNLSNGINVVCTQHFFSNHFCGTWLCETPTLVWLREDEVTWPRPRKEKSESIIPWIACAFFSGELQLKFYIFVFFLYLNPVHIKMTPFSIYVWFYNTRKF